MKLYNIRLGFACNSSSTHSLVFFQNAEFMEDAEIDDNQFGWQNFVAASPRAKQQYLAQQIYNALANETTPLIAKTVVDDWVGCKLLWNKFESRDALHDGPGAVGSVDHQSQFAIPASWTGHGVDKEYVDDLIEFVMQPGLVVLGGNDNDDPHPLLSQGQVVGNNIPTERYGMVGRKDPSGFWTLFDRKSGNKIRFSFNNEPTPRYAVAPELVDIKITNQCNRGCEYCYQNSKPDGEHADDNDGLLLYTLPSILEKLKVFEVAIGGGEPTLHPKFVEILQSFRSHGVVPNFTTRNLSWLDNDKLRPEILEACGSFAVSVDKSCEIEALATTLRYHNIHNRCSVQYVLGTTYELLYILKAAHENQLPITLLGFKNTGRGEKGKTYRTDDRWLETVKTFLSDNKNAYVKIGIDTAIAKEFGNEIGQAGVTKTFYTKEEGTFSMYIDAVEGKWGPSSYAPDQMVSMPDNRYSITTDMLLKAFHTFRNQPEANMATIPAKPVGDKHWLLKCGHKLPLENGKPKSAGTWMQCYDCSLHDSAPHALCLSCHGDKGRWAYRCPVCHKQVEVKMSWDGGK